jgi:hypothetical protein
VTASNQDRLVEAAVVVVQTAVVVDTVVAVGRVEVAMVCHVVVDAHTVAVQGDSGSRTREVLQKRKKTCML